MLFEGGILFFAPNLLLTLVNLPQTNEVWIRLLGIAFLVLGYYYIKLAQITLTAFFEWTVKVRIMQFFLVSFAVIITSSSPIILLFSGVELLSGIWTYFVLKKEKLDSKTS